MRLWFAVSLPDGYLGAEGYVQANEKNDKVQCAFTASDANGTLDEACYYSRICVKTENADQYKDGDTYSIDNIKGKSFSFVSATSTSGFAIPSSSIVEKFGLESSDELLEDGKFFSSVMFGDSHQGSAVNLLSGNAEAAAFDDIDVDMYFDLVSGEPNTVGAVYQVKDDAEAPFDTVRGEQFTIIGITPVLNAPFCYNTDTLSEDEQKEIDETIKSIREQAASSDYSLNAYLRLYYGRGVNEKILREAMELETLSSKLIEQKSDELARNYTDEQLEAKYQKDQNTYNVLTARMFQFTTETPDYPKDATDAQKKELDEKAKKETKAKADAMLGKVTGEESFKEQALANASKDQKDDYKRTRPR